jgi:hypothetical protein
MIKLARIDQGAMSKCKKNSLQFCENPKRSQKCSRECNFFANYEIMKWVFSTFLSNIFFGVSHLATFISFGIEYVIASQYTERFEPTTSWTWAFCPSGFFPLCCFVFRCQLTFLPTTLFDAEHHEPFYKLHSRFYL